MQYFFDNQHTNKRYFILTVEKLYKICVNIKQYYIRINNFLNINQTSLRTRGYKNLFVDPSTQRVQKGSLIL